MTTQRELQTGDWPAPTLAEPPKGLAHLHIPGSKSLTNRYLLLAALADSPSRIRRPLLSRDSQLMIGALEQLGARFSYVEQADEVTPDIVVEPIDFSSPALRKPRRLAIDTGLAGTVMRFAPPVAALVPGEITFDGDPHARKRPMGPVIDALRHLGVTVDDDNRSAMPFTMHSTGQVLQPELHIDASASSQFVSAVLLAAARFERGVTLRHVGAAIPSMPHVQMTLEVMREVGIEVTTLEDTAWRVAPGAFPGFEVTVEPDLSNAGPFLAAAVVMGGTVAIADWPSTTTQGGDQWRQILPRFGARVTEDRHALRVTGPAGGAASGYPGIDIDLSEAGELAPTVAALCALADSPSVLRGIGHLRGHETDRLAALVSEINRLGGQASETADGLRIDSPVKHGALFRTYDDHRMATAAAVIGLHVPDVVVENVATTAKTLPGFTEMWQSMLDQFVQEETDHGAE
ncbi:3-phosphoshikimate 1-carboxyvinyltransferase [Rothia sp. LK2588]|uniref:3-phosphoshikimate 1-carboxyvinyltransferase n=1 Tax=Rothia sp. LK2588 TaxID=3114369 RepID=UPI0039082856